MNAPTIRIMFEEQDGALVDGHMDYDLEDFGGILPVPGDAVFNRWVTQHRDRNNPAEREMWEVRRRVFNPKDNGGGYIALVVFPRPLKKEELALMP